MSASNFRKAIQDYIITHLTSVVGPGTGDPFVRTFDNHLDTAQKELASDFPHVVVNVRQTSVQPSKTEIGVLKEPQDWQIHIYYLDITQEGESYNDGEARRDTLVHAIQHNMQIDYNFGNLRVPVAEDVSITEYVYDSDFTDILFDSSGQQDYYYFTCELYLTVNTAKN